MATATTDRRHEDNGQGRVTDPANDRRLKENRDNSADNNSGRVMDSSDRRLKENREGDSTVEGNHDRRHDGDSGQGRVTDPSSDRRLKANRGSSDSEQGDNAHDENHNEIVDNTNNMISQMTQDLQYHEDAAKFIRQSLQEIADKAKQALEAKAETAE